MSDTLTDLGLITELDAGRYRAVIRAGVHANERTDTTGSVWQVMVPISRVSGGELIFRAAT